MEIERIIQYICTFLGVISLSFIYAKCLEKRNRQKRIGPAFIAFYT